MSVENIKRTFNQISINELNDKYRPLTPEQRVRQLYNDFKEVEIMLTSSFAATSALLLKLFSDIHPSQEVLFIDTGYHFKDTLIYKDYLTQLYNLKVTSVRAE